MAYVALFLVSPEFKRQSECLVLEDMKMITCSNLNQLPVIINKLINWFQKLIRCKYLYKYIQMLLV